jgi:hypothetical protein
MSVIDSEPGLVLSVLLYLDSPTAFKSRRCCRVLAKLFAKGGLNRCRDLLEGISFNSGSHTTKGGIWLPLISEDVLSTYVRFCSATKLATDLEFKDMTAVAGLQKASCMFNSIAPEDGVSDNGKQFKLGYITRHGRPICLKGRQLGSLLHSYMSRSQQFLGSWTFNAESLKAMLSRKEVDVVYSSCVEFHAMLRCSEGEVGPAVQSQDKLSFGVQLMLSRTAGDRFVLSWRPCVTTTSLLEEHKDRFNIHLHGHAAVPFTLPLGYEGAILPSSPAEVHIKGDVPIELALSMDDITELLNHDCLKCALCIQFFHEDQAVPVNPTTDYDLDAQFYWPQCTESGPHVDKEDKFSSAPRAKSVVTESRDLEAESRSVPLSDDATDLQNLPQAKNWVSETTVGWLCVGIFFVTHLLESGRLSVLFSNL